jgi:Carbohydrate binding module 27
MGGKNQEEKMKRIVFCVTFVMVMAMSALLFAAEEIIFDFEDGLGGWDVPAWAYEKPDHVQREIGQSDAVAATGENSLEVITEYPGGSWAGAIVEVMQMFDWSDADAVAVDIFLPQDGPEGLKGKMILTVGETWKWVEMSRDFELIPGEWTTIKADLKPGSIDWRRVQVDESFRQDVRKMDVRVISNGSSQYSGPFYIDNVRLIKETEEIEETEE